MNALMLSTAVYPTRYPSYIWLVPSISIQLQDLSVSTLHALGFARRYPHNYSIAEGTGSA